MRLSTPISKHLRNCKSWKCALASWKKAFRAEMKGRAYGYEATFSAWEWFVRGLISR